MNTVEPFRVLPGSTSFAAEAVRKACHLDRKLVLGDDFYDAYFDFFKKTMTGAKEMQPRWKRSLNVASSLLPEAVGANPH